MKKITWRRMKRLALSALACLLILGGLQVAFHVLERPPQVAHAAGAFINDDILMIHGFNKDSQISCSGTFGLAKAGFQLKINASAGSGTVRTIGYYSNATGCDASIASPDTRCALYFAPSGSDEATNREDLKHVACKLAWYIWDNYTLYGRNVNVVAHSAGGVVIRWAIYGTARQLTNPGSSSVAFPPTLIIHNVVTGSSPHAGVSLANAKVIGCDGCVQGDEIVTGSAVMNDLNG